MLATVTVVAVPVVLTLDFSGGSDDAVGYVVVGGGGCGWQWPTMCDQDKHST